MLLEVNAVDRKLWTSVLGTKIIKHMHKICNGINVCVRVYVRVRACMRVCVHVCACMHLFMEHKYKYQDKRTCMLTRYNHITQYTYIHAHVIQRVNYKLVPHTASCDMLKYQSFNMYNVWL